MTTQTQVRSTEEALSVFDTLKLALEALYPISHNTTDDPRGQADKAINAIKEALQSNKQLKPEHSATHGEPVAVVDLRNVNYVRWLDGAVFFEGTKLYTAPSHHKPLTGKQVQDLFIDGMKSGSFDCKKFARAIEAAHGIKE